jgi:Chitin synthesis regulation, resistance to Congo red
MSSFEKDPARNLPLVKAPQSGEKRAARWQIAATAIGVIVVIVLFLWGLNNQRDETAGQQTAGTQPMQVTPQSSTGGPPPAQNQQQAGQQQQSQSNAPTTTGQGSADHGGDAQKSNAGQTTNQQPTNPGQNDPPTDNNSQAAQPGGQ